MKTLDDSGIRNLEAIRHKAGVCHVAEVVAMEILLYITFYILGPVGWKLGLCVVVAGASLAILVVFKLISRDLLKRTHALYDTATLRWTAEGVLLVESHRQILDMIPTLPTGLVSLGPESPEVEVVRQLVELAIRQENERVVKSDNYRQIRDLLASAPRLTALFQAHLHQANTTTETAALRIMTKLTSLNHEVASLQTTLDETTTMASGLFDNSQLKVQENQKMLADLTTYQREMEKQVQSAIQLLIREMDGLKPFTELIREVNAKTNVLAINAAIEAARAGSAGRGFAVVAAEVRTLSQQVASATESIEATVKGISETVAVKLGALSKLMHGDDKTQGFVSLTVALPKLSQEFFDTVKLLKSFALATQANVNDIQKSIVDVMGYAQFQDITRQQIEQVDRGLDLSAQHMKGAAEALAGPGTLPLVLAPLDGIAEQMSHDYTMLRQKDTHQKVLHGKLEKMTGARPDIELF